MNSDVYLWVQTPERSGQALGRLVVRGLRPDGSQAPPPGLAVTLDFVADVQFYESRPCRWIQIAAEIWSLRVPPRQFGRVQIDLWTLPMQEGMPKFRPGAQQITWHWVLRHEDLGAIEDDYAQVSSSPRAFALKVVGVVQVGDAPYAIVGDGSFECAASEWEQLLKQMQYGLPPNVLDVLGPAAVARGYWSAAEGRLAPARAQLRAGETHHALGTCLGEFERIVSAPYRSSSWKGFGPTETWPEQKAEALTALLAAHCTYLNRVGHHKDREERDAQGRLIVMPVEHWEADLVVAASHMLLAYALRLRDRSQP